MRLLTLPLTDRERLYTQHRCDSPVLLPLEGYFVDQQTIYLQAPMYPTLEDWLSTPHTYQEQFELIQNLLRSVDVLHSANVVHGALWPFNVFLTPTPVFGPPSTVWVSRSQKQKQKTKNIKHKHNIKHRSKNNKQKPKQKQNTQITLTR